MSTSEQMTQFRPAGNMELPSRQALIDTEGQRAIQEVQASLVIAKRFPRDTKDALDRILNSCCRPSLAEQALYSYPKGNQDVTGPSIRLAEAIAQQWGNISFGIRELEQRDGESTVEAFAWDLETNTRQVKVFQVSHKRFTKQGSKTLTDSRDIYELVANQGARRLRACILGVIPGDVIDEAVRQCETTLETTCNAGSEMQEKIIKVFAKYGVTKEMIEKRIQRRIDAITPAQVAQLKKIHSSLKDGMGQASDWFDAPAKQSAPQQSAPADPFANAQQQEQAAPQQAAPQEQPQDDFNLF